MALAQSELIQDQPKRLVATFAMQAIIDAKTGLVFGYELLARDVRGKDRSAAGIIERLTSTGRRRLALEAVSYAQVMAQVAQSPRLHVNLDIEDLDLVTRMGDLTNITIEIVEGCVDPEVLASAIEMIHERGGHAAMDDFGSQLWSGNALENDWDLVKLDKCVLSWTEDRWSDLQGDLAKHCPDADVCLEGIETEEHLRAARTTGATLLQGYACGVPLIPQIHPQVELIDPDGCL
jgi:EAL domain-containing protein (putative c-di-GMP-specific phosphodiesterase class I)